VRTAAELLAAAAGAALPTPSAALSRCLGGGVSRQHITEVVGPPGVGKTRFCYGLAVECVVSGAGAVVYIDAERKLSPSALAAVARARLGPDGADGGAMGVEDVLQRITVVRPGGAGYAAAGLGLCGDLTDLLSTRLEGFLVTHDVALVVYDSIAHVMRMEFGAQENLLRHGAVMGQVARLKTMATQLNLAVVVVNHVSAAGGTAEGSVGSASGEVAYPTLGNSFHHAVNVRLALEKGVVAGGALSYRLRVAKSPSCPTSVVPYVHGPGGLEFTDTTTVADDGAFRDGDASRAHNSVGVAEAYWTDMRAFTLPRTTV
jgi:RAD51-like protein 1